MGSKFCNLHVVEDKNTIVIKECAVFIKFSDSFRKLKKNFDISAAVCITSRDVEAYKNNFPY